MKQKRILKMMIPVLAGGFLAFGVSAVGTPGLLKPLTALGKGLRVLSLGSGIGNVAAWVLVLGMSALPLLLLIKKKWNPDKKDLLLPLASVELFAMVYYLVNPTEISPELVWMGAEGLRSLWALACGGVFTVTLLAWLLLTCLDRIEGNPGSLLQKLLVLCAVLLAFLGGFDGVQELITEISSVKEGNTDLQIAQSAGILKSVVMLIRLVPTVLSAGVLFWAGDLVRAVKEEPFGESLVALGEEIACKCKNAVRITVYCTLAANLLQLLFLPHLGDVRIHLELPLITMALCGALYLLWGYFRKSKEIHDDNASII